LRIRSSGLVAVRSKSANQGCPYMQVRFGLVSDLFKRTLNSL